jgi:succinate dehydrogenase/fumarate reductase cytochrome b subunit
MLSKHKLLEWRRTQKSGELLNHCTKGIFLTVSRLQYTDKAVTSARAARKKRWICFFITLILLAVIGIVVGIVVKNQINATKK